MKTSNRRLVFRLVGAVAIAFVASMVLTWILHERMTKREMQRIFDNVFSDVAVDIRERVDAKMLRQAMLLRDKYYEMWPTSFASTRYASSTPTECLHTARAARRWGL